MDIQSSMSSSIGESVTIYGSIINESGINRLIIAAKGRFSSRRSKAEFAFVSDDDTSGCDMYFTKERFREAYSEYRKLLQQGRLLLDSRIEEYRLEHVIEESSQKMNGETDYNMQLLSNGHFAVLAMCLFFRQQDNYEAVKEITNDIFGSILTI